MNELHLSSTFGLPVAAVTDSSGILAKKGAGKSNAAVVMAEEMHAAGVAWVAIDPKGDWWGVRAAGTGPGLSVPVFGGKHGDIPLEPTAGALLADTILGDDDRGYLTCVLDVAQFTISEQRRFLLDFGQRLFQRKDEERVLHLFLEEAHEYLPQRVERDQTKLVSTWQRIVKQGRFKGLGVTVISQRSAALNKDVLTQVDSLYVLRTLSPQDRAAVKAWLDVHIGASGVISTLHELKAGEAWLWSPDRFADPVRFQFRRRSTFDSGATPEFGAKPSSPATLADVDLAAIKEQMAETIEKAAADDPKALRKRITVLERQLRDMERSTPEPIIGDDVLDRLQDIEGHAREAIGALSDQLLEVATLLHTKPSVAPPRVTPARTERAPQSLKPQVASPRQDTFSDGALPGPQRKLLIVLATYGPRTKRQLALLSGYSIGGGAFNNPLGKIRSSGYVDPPRGEPMAITQAGLDVLGEYEPLPAGPDLLAYWLSNLPGPQRKILAALADHWPHPYTKDELAGATGYSPEGGAFNNPLGKLRTLELVTRGPLIALTDDFAQAIA